MPGLLQGNVNQGIFEEERVFGSLGVRSVIGLPIGIIINSQNLLLSENSSRL